MGITPGFASEPRSQIAAVDTANTNLNGSGAIVEIFTAGDNGSLVEQTYIASTGDPADCVLRFFVWTGSAWGYFHALDIGDPVAASTTVPGYTHVINWAEDNTTSPIEGLKLQAGWKLGAAITVAPTSGGINLFSVGGDY